MHCGCNAPYVGPSLSTTCYNNTFVFFMSLINTLAINNCEISEICERVSSQREPDLEYDFIVIGGGSAGSVVAARLSEVPHWKVLLVEAGGDEPPGSQIPSMMNNYQGTAIDWNFRTDPQEEACLGYPERRCTWPRGRVLGGCGVINGMMYIRGLPQDYDEWEGKGNEHWGYQQVLEFFKVSEGNKEIGALVSGEEHGREGPMTTSRFPHRPRLADDMLRAAKEAGFPVVDDLNSAPFQGFTIAQANNRNGTRLTSARAYLRPARNRPNLHIMLNSTATKILLSHKRATGVRFISNHRTFFIRARREVILSAGAIKSPQLLLLSGIGPNHTIDLPGVGKNLQNHVSFVLNFELKSVPAVNDLDWLSSDDYFLFRRSPLASTGMAQVTGRLATKYAQDPSRPDLQFFFSGFLANCSRFGLLNEPQCPGAQHVGKVVSIAPVTIRPRSRGVIKLASNDPLAPPSMNPNYLTEIEDLNTLVEGVRIAQKLANTRILREVYGAEIIRKEYGNCSRLYTHDSDSFWRCAIRFATAPENHQCCSCKMAPASDPLAVVDATLRVHGVDGLRVIDASIMPIVVPGNTQATVVMIAERGAYFIKRKWLGT